MSNNVSGWNAMIVDAEAAGGTCYLPGGVANFNGDLNYGPFINLVGQGCGSTNIGYNPPGLVSGATVLRMHSANHGPQFLQTGVAPGPTNNSWYWNGGRIAGIDFDGNGIGTVGLNFRMMTMGHMSSCNIYNWTDTCLKLDASIGNLVEDLSFYGTPNGISATSFDPGTGALSPNFSKVHNCDFNLISNWGIQYDNCSSVHISDCNFSYGGSTGTQPTNTGNILIARPRGDLGGPGVVIDRCWMEGIKGGYGVKLDQAVGGPVFHSICNSAISFGSPGYYGVFLDGGGPQSNHLLTHTCIMSNAGQADVHLEPVSGSRWARGPGVYAVVEITSAIVTDFGF